MEFTGFRLPTAWLCTIRSVGETHPYGASGIMREALDEWAESRGLDLITGQRTSKEVA